MRRLGSPFWRIVSFLALAPLLLAVAFAQAPDKKKPREEEEAKPKPPMGKKPPEEEGGDTTPDKVIRVDDPRTDPSRTPVVQGNIDLGAAAKGAKHAAIRNLYMELAVPRDVLQIGNDTTGFRDTTVRPVPEFIRAQSGAKKITLKPVDKTGREQKAISPSAAAIRDAVYYEQIAMREVDRFLKEIEPQLLAKLTAAEQALACATHVHTTVRKGDGWDTIRDKLRLSLLGVSLQRLHLLAETADWDAAVALAKDTVKRSPAGDHATIADALGKLTSKLLDTDDKKRVKEAIARLRQIEEALPNNEATKPIREKLIALADPLVKEAERFHRDNRIAEAQAKVREAAEIYPNHPGLRGLRSDVDNKFPTLRVGTRELPQYLSPALAFTDSEKQAVEMLFEGLYEAGPEPDGGRFHPALALGRPRRVAQAREMALPRDVYWSNHSSANPNPITASDVSYTVRLLRQADFPGKAHAWGDELIDDVAVTDPLRFRITFKQGYLDPTSLLSFKLLPAKSALRRADDKDFAQNPVGSGPFQYDLNVVPHEKRVEALFTANPFYRNRPGKVGLPRLSAIRFIKSADPVKDLRDGKVDLLLDVPVAQISSLKQAKDIKVSAALPSRRIYFLAVNCRRDHLDNASFRRAIANAIPRDQLLDAHFRKGVPGVHHALHGPYPVNTWACDPSVRLDPTKAKAAFKDSKKGPNLEFDLLYPLDDPAVEAAVNGIAKSVKDELGITLKPTGRKPQVLRDDVERDRNYSLAYYWYDYPDATFWLWPLIDPRGNDRNVGKNFFSFDGGTELPSLCADALAHRSFDRVRSITHFIHRTFVQKDMPFIPLWQLDRHIAHSTAVKLLDGLEELKLDGPSPTIDPLRVFGTIESWRVER